jgi:hypothetical protein
MFDCMSYENSLTGWLRAVFGGYKDTEVVEDEDDDEPDHRPIVGLETVRDSVSHVAEYEIERTVELIHFAQGGTLVVEYDNMHEDGQSLIFKSVTEVVDDGKSYQKSGTTMLGFGNTVSTVNDMAVAHREEIGTINVTVERPVTLSERYERVVNMDELPDEVILDGVPERHLVARDENDSDFDRGWGGAGFQKYDEQVVWNLDYCHDSFDGPTSIEADRSMGEVLQDAVQGGSSAMRAVSADGSVLMPDHEVGGGDDVTQVQALPDRQP